MFLKQKQKHQHSHLEQHRRTSCVVAQPYLRLRGVLQAGTNRPPTGSPACGHNTTSLPAEPDLAHGHKLDRRNIAIYPAVQLSPTNEDEVRRYALMPQDQSCSRPPAHDMAKPGCALSSSSNRYFHRQDSPKNSPAHRLLD